MISPSRWNIEERLRSQFVAVYEAESPATDDPIRNVGIEVTLGDRQATAEHGYAVPDSAQPEPTASPTATDSASAEVSVSEGGGTATTMHIADLTSTSINNGRTWTAVVTITVRDNTGEFVGDATVTGSWSGPVSQADSCTTGTDGTCTVEVGGIHKSNRTVTYTVTDVTHASFAYSSSDNVETSIIVSKP